MKEYKVLILVFLFVFINAISFGVNVDSLIEQYNKDKSINKLEDLFQIANALRLKNPNEALIYIEKLEDLAKQENNILKKADAFKLRGDVFYKNKDYEGAIDNYRKALDLRFKESDVKGAADLHYNIAFVYRKWNSYKLSIDHFEESLKLYQRINSLSDVGDCKRNIGKCHYYLGNYYRSMENYKSALDIAMNTNDTVSLKNSYQFIGVLYNEWGQYDKAIEAYQSSLEYSEATRDSVGIANNLLNIGLIYQKWDGAMDKAFEYYEKSIAIMNSLNYTYGLANDYGVIGEALHENNQNSEALNYLLKAIEISKENKFHYLILKNLVSLGKVYSVIEKYEESNSNLDEAITLAIEMDNKVELCKANFNKGLNYKNQGKYDLAKSSFKSSLDIAEKKGFVEIKKDIYKALSDLYDKSNNVNLSYNFYKKYIDIKDQLYNDKIHKQLNDIEAKYQTEKKEQQIKLQQATLEKNNVEIESQRKVIILFVVLFVLILILIIVLVRQNKIRQRTNKVLAEQKSEILEKNEELNQQKEEILAQSEQLEKTNIELKKLSLVADKTDNAVIIADAEGNFEWFNNAFSVLYGYTFEQYIDTKGKNIFETSANPRIRKDIETGIRNKTSVVYVTESVNALGKKLWVQTTLTPIFDEDDKPQKIVAIDSDITGLKEVEKELEEQRDIALSQRDKISIQNQEITDSINYALQIQQALLPPVQFLKDNFFDFFVFFKPRDIVSGDFYFFSQKGDKKIVVVADCTGHGVPGAFMSLLGITFLNEIISNRGILHTDAILHELRTLVINTLHQTDVNSVMKDGMDMSICIYDKSENVIEYSGANNSIYIVRDKELKEYKADKIPIGVHVKMNEPFTRHAIEVENGDYIYMFTDGYADQFGGPLQDKGGKKFKYKALKQLLVDNVNLPGTVQQQTLETTLSNWKGNLDQIDDILVVGFKL